ncbi:MAG: tetratricopeptide repeat protein [Candidatus Obscuribacterales bacterium]|nr:tetratricopeptide repeat protein [Candidatus Obscuribacterales bacterium]
MRENSLILFFSSATLIALTISGCTREEQSTMAHTTLATLERTLSTDGGFGDTPEQWTKKIEKDPKDARLYYFRANSYAVRKEFRMAVQDCDTAIRLDPKLAVAYYFRADYSRMLGNYERAIGDFTEALAKIPKYQRELLDRIDLVFAGRGSCYSSLKKYDLALNDFDEALRENSGNAAVLVLRSCLYLERGQANLALVDAERAVSAEKSALTLEHLGRVLRETKRYDRALTVLNEPMTLSPETLDFFREKATLFRDLRRYQEGIALASECLAIAPNDVVLYLVRGQCYSRSGDYQKAVRDYSTAIRVAAPDSPIVPFVYFERSSTYEVLGELEKAEADLSYVLRTNSALEPVSTKRRYIELLSSQAKPEKLAQAISISTELINESPTAYDYHRRSTLFEHEKNYTAALEDLKKAAAMDQSYAGKYLELKARAGAMPPSANN